MDLKTIKELKQGKCTVIAEYDDSKKEFEGFYNEKLKIVFFAISDKYEIKGYIQ